MWFLLPEFNCHTPYKTLPMAITFHSGSEWLDIMLAWLSSWMCISDAIITLRHLNTRTHAQNYPHHLLILSCPPLGNVCKRNWNSVSIATAAAPFLSLLTHTRHIGRMKQGGLIRFYERVTHNCDLIYIFFFTVFVIQSELFVILYSVCVCACVCVCVFCVHY